MSGMSTYNNERVSFGAIVREMQVLLSDKFMVALIFAIPILSFLCFAGIYTQRVVRDLPLVVIDHDNTSLSRQLKRAFDSTPSMKLVEAANDNTPIVEYFKRGDIAAVLVIPEKFERDVRAGIHPTLIFYKHSANIIVSNLLYSDGQTTAKMVSAAIGIQKLGSKGVPPHEALHCVSPITIQNSPLYNPNYSYEQFMPVSVYLALLQMMFLVASVVHIFKLKESERGYTFQTGMLSFFSQSILHGLSVSVVLFVLYPLFGIDLSSKALPIIGLTFILFVFLYLLSVIVGLQKEGLSKALEMIVFFATPGFIFSGYTFPLRGMPAIFSIGKYFPFSVYLNAFLKCTFMNAPSEAFGFETAYTFYAGGILLVILSALILVREHAKGRVAQ